MSEFHRKCELFMKFVKEPYEKRKEDAGETTRAYYAKCCINSPIYEGKILYESLEGSGMQGNLLALFLELLERLDGELYEHIWVLETEEKQRYYENRWKGFQNVRFVIRESKEYLKALTECRYLLNDSTFPSYFMKREGQVYLNTWHGIPIQKIGYECKDGEKTAANIIRNFLSTDYLISSGGYMTKRYEEGFLLKGIYPGRIVETGLPRMDLLFRFDKKEVYKELKNKGILVSPEKELLLYAPGIQDGEEEINQSLEYTYVYEQLTKNLPRNKYQILIKPDARAYAMLSEEEKKKGYYIPDTIDMGLVLTITEVLITDCLDNVFDYLLFERPVMFYLPEAGAEQQKLGQLKEELPGPVVDKLSGVLWWLIHKKEWENRYLLTVRSIKEKYCPYEDGDSAVRVADLLLGQELEPEEEVTEKAAAKKRLLFYAGSMKTNGITVSLMALLDLLDLEKYDITVYLQAKKEESSVFSAKDFKKGIRPLVRVPKYNATLREEFYHGMISELGVSHSYCKQNYPTDFYRREYRRCFGDATFDEIIDYSGYGSFMARVLLAAPSGRKFIWQHSDMKRDQKRKVDGDYPFETELKVIFSLYDQFDGIISCGREVMQINRDTLANEETYEKFTYVENPVSIRRIQKGLKEEKILERFGMQYLLLQGKKEGNVYYADKMIPLPAEDEVTFVMVGRLSPEKNPMAAVKAFERFLRKEERARLYLIGDGPLAEEIKKYVTRHGLKEAVCLTGNLANPFPLIRHCGCFLLPSKWEGQSLAVGEMRVLHKPILISDYNGYEAACEEGGQKVIHTDSDSIYKGMVAFQNGEVPTISWNEEAYNEQVREQFEDLIERDGKRRNQEGE